MSELSETRVIRREPSGPLEKLLDNACKGKHKQNINDDPRTRANRAKLHDSESTDSTFDQGMLRGPGFSDLDRGNLIRIAQAVEELNQVFKNTAKIEVSNTAIGVLSGLVSAINRLDSKIDSLDKTLQKMTSKRRKGGKALEKSVS